MLVSFVLVPFEFVLLSRVVAFTWSARNTQQYHAAVHATRKVITKGTLSLHFPFFFVYSLFSLSTFCTLLVQTQEGTRNKSTQTRERKGTLHTSPHPLFSLCLVLFLPFSKKFPAFAEMQAKRSLQGTPFSLSSLPFEFVLPFKVLRKKQHGHQEVIIMCSFLPHFLSSSCLLVVIS